MAPTILQTTGVVVDGRLVLDTPIDLPDGTRVLVTIETVEKTPIHGGWNPTDRESPNEQR